MVSVSHIVRNLVEEKPLLYQGLVEGVISYAGLAEYLLPEIKKELGKEVKLPAIVMAVRRYSEVLKKKSLLNSGFEFDSDIIMKTGLADLTIVKSPASLEKVENLYPLVDYDRGDTLNIIQGNYEITIVISEKHLEDVKKILDGEKILNIEKNLVSLSISFSKEFLYTPGVISKVTRKLAWENINIFENISTMTELIYIISKKDSVRAYKALERLVGENNNGEKDSV